MQGNKEYTFSAVPSYYPRRYLLGLALMTALLILALAFTYRAYIHIEPKLDPSNFYGMLGDAFISGQTYLKMAPSPMLLALPDPYDPAAHEPYSLWDASLYNGKYYLYFGAVPGLVWAAAKLVTGISLTDPQLVLGFSIFGTACLSTLLVLIAIRNKIAHFGGIALAILSLGLGTWLPFMLRRPSFYEVAISGAYCFSAFALLLLWYGFSVKGRNRLFCFAFASVCFGLAVGCRPPHALNGVILGITWLAIAVRKEKHVIGSLICLLGPWWLCLMGIGVYNYVRFDSPFEAGCHYQLTFYNSHHMNFTMIQWERLVPNLYYYLLRPLPFAHPFMFPFFHVTYYDEVVLPGGIRVNTMEPLYGLLPNSPFSLWILAAPYFWVKRRALPLTSETRVILAGISLYGFGLLGVLLFFFYTTVRYSIDFCPWWMLIAGMQYLRLLNLAKSRWAMGLLIALGVATAFYGAFAGTMSGYCGQYLCEAK